MTKSTFINSVGLAGFALVAVYALLVGDMSAAATAGGTVITLLAALGVKLLPDGGTPKQ